MVRLRGVLSLMRNRRTPLVLDEMLLRRLRRGVGGNRINRRVLVLRALQW
jgi:hypothetical protein